MAAEFGRMQNVAQDTDTKGETASPDNSAAEAEFEGENSAAAAGVTARIREAVKSAGGYSQVAARSDLPGRTLSRILGGQEPKLSHLVALARATFVRLEWLATGHGTMHGGEPLLLEDGSPILAEDQARLPPGTVLIRRYDARASAGPGTGVDSGPLVENMAFPAAFVHEQLRRDPEHLAVIECIGDSMEPTLHDGDLLLVDTSRQRPTTGRIYVLRVGDALLAKRMQRLAGGGWSLISDNPRYATEELRPSDETRLDVLGEVVWRSGNLAP